MKCFTEEEQEELDRISESMPEFDFDKSEREREIITKLEEPEVQPKQPVRKRSSKRYLSTMMALSMFTSCLGSEKKPYECEYEPVNIKGAPGVYNPDKHLSRAQRKRKKMRSNKKNH